MGRALLLAIGGLFLAFASTTAFAACPVGKGEGDTWCENGYKWKCERCGSEYCSIMQPGSCHKDEAPAGRENDAKLDISRLLKPASLAARGDAAYSPRR